MRVTFFVLLFLLIAIPVKAQVQLSAGVGFGNSINMGEIGPSPVFKSTFTIGDKFRLENDFEFSSMDKYTRAGWYASNGVDFLIFPSQNFGFFLIGGVDYRHRNGGTWSKDGIRVGGGAGYEKENSQFRFSVKDKIISLNDNIKYYPYYELFVRGDNPLNDSWSLRVQTEIGVFKYIQNNTKSTAFYLSSVVGLVYKWS